jgi:uncharacterized protein YeaO (DUF488 family)
VIYTSYYNASRDDPRAVGISRGRYQGFDGPYYDDLAPSSSLLKEWQDHRKRMTWDEYTRRYHYETLSRLNPRRVGRELDWRVLLCFEAKPPCHRFIVAEWLRGAGFAVEELTSF